MLALNRDSFPRSIKVRLTILLFTSIGASACLLDAPSGVECTPADSTYSCCLKKHLADRTVACDGIDRVEAPVPKPVPPPTASIGGKALTMAAAALVLSDIDRFKTAQPEIEEILKQCARAAEDEVNRKWLGGRKPTKEDCAEELESKTGDEPTTRAARWGIEKHEMARRCLEKRLNQFIKGQFSLEQRYLYDPLTGRKALLSQKEVDDLLRQGRANELKGTLQPDVVIHSGDPLQAWAVYDFKFPCPERNPPLWKIYPKGPPYNGRSQGDVYSKAFGRTAARVAPGWEILEWEAW